MTYCFLHKTPQKKNHPSASQRVNQKPNYTQTSQAKLNKRNWLLLSLAPFALLHYPHPPPLDVVFSLRVS